MQKNFGEKLKEARTQQGISIRQVSDAIKIRSDFLESFEEDNGNFDMPDVYKRGFIKLYARYLKLDVEEILQDFLAYHHQSANPQFTTPLNTEQPQKVLAQISLPDEDPENPPQNSEGQVDFNFNTQPTETPTRTPETQQTHNHTSSSPTSTDPRNLYLKVGLTFAGALCILSLIAVMVGKMVSSPSQATTTEEEIVSSFESDMPEASDAFTLSTDSEVHVFVRQESDRQRIFSGNIDKSKPVTLDRKGPVKIHFSNGSQLVIHKADGKKVRPSREGAGWIEI